MTVIEIWLGAMKNGLILLLRAINEFHKRNALIHAWKQLTTVNGESHIARLTNRKAKFLNKIRSHKNCQFWLTSNRFWWNDYCKKPAPSAIKCMQFCHAFRAPAFVVSGWKCTRYSHTTSKYMFTWIKLCSVSYRALRRGKLSLHHHLTNTPAQTCILTSLRAQYSFTGR